MDLGFDDANEVGGWYELKPVVVVVMGTSSRRRERYMMSPGVLVSVFTSWYGTKVSVLVLVYTCCTVHCSHSSLYRVVHSGAEECSYSEGGSVTWTSSTQFLLVLSQPVTCHIVLTIVT